MNTTVNAIDEDARLDAGFEAIRRAASALPPPDELEARLRRQLYGATRAGVTRACATNTVAATGSKGIAFRERWAAWLVWPVSVAATIVLCSWMLVRQPAIDPAIDGPRSVAELEAMPSYESADGGTPFLALAPLDEIAAAGQSEIVATTVPRATLAGFGLPVSPMHAGDDIAAEFLVAPGGGLLAVRFVVADVR